MSFVLGYRCILRRHSAAVCMALRRVAMARPRRRKGGMRPGRTRVRLLLRRLWFAALGAACAGAFSECCAVRFFHVCVDGVGGGVVAVCLGCEVGVAGAVGADVSGVSRVLLSLCLCCAFLRRLHTAPSFLCLVHPTISLLRLSTAFTCKQTAAVRAF